MDSNNVEDASRPVTAVKCSTDLQRTSCFPTRFQIATMLFGSITFSFLLRSSMSLNVLAMVQPRREAGSNVTTVAPDFGPRFDWTQMQQSVLLGAGFAGSIVVIIPFGILLDRFGHVRQVVLGSFIASACFQFAGPLSAATSFEALVINVLLTGIMQGGMVIAAHKMFTTWAPPTELGIFTSAIMGTNLGTIVSWTVSGALIESFGWPSSFYFNGALTCVFIAAWAYVAYDSPALHPRISPAEREFIERSLEDNAHHTNTWPPIWSMMTSVPVWCLLLLQFGNLWGLFFLLTAAPKFISEILGFHLAGTGVLASVPYLARILGSIGWAVLGKQLHLKCDWRLVNLRKFFCIFSHILPGLCFIALPFASSTPFACIAIMALSQALNGSAPQSTFATFHDIAPNYAVTMVSIINTIGSVSGVAAPLLVAYFTAEQNTIEEWRTVFTIGAIGYILPAIVFLALGSASVQPWDGLPQGTDASEATTATSSKSHEAESGEYEQHVAATNDRCVRGVTIRPLYEMW